jgi:hypothetical protein
MRETRKDFYKGERLSSRRTFMFHRLAANSRYRIFIFLVVGMAHFSVRAPAAESPSSSLPPVIAITEGKTPQGFPYLSGGVSTDEREAMEKQGKGYNVKLSFAEKRGPYLSDVKLVIAGAKATEIISTITNGPWFYIQLPPGSYAVKATFNDKTREIKRLEVPKDGTVQQTLTWDLGGQ